MEYSPHISAEKERPLSGRVLWAIGWFVFLFLTLLFVGIAGPSYRGYLEVLDLVIFGIAVHKASLLLAREMIDMDPSSERTRKEGVVRFAASEILSSPSASAPWLAVLFIFGFLFMPYLVRLIASVLVVIAIADFLHHAYLRTWIRTGTSHHQIV